jgi:hypothetical protein
MVLACWLLLSAIPTFAQSRGAEAKKDPHREGGREK